MNERIKELAEQVYGSAATAQEIEFAELIVRECVDIAIQVDKNPYLEDHYHARQIIKNINKHFGVEE